MSNNPIDEARELVEHRGPLPIETPEDAHEVLEIDEAVEIAERRAQALESEDRAEQQSGAYRARPHEQRADKLKALDNRLKRSAARKLGVAADTLDGRETGRIPDEEWLNVLGPLTDAERVNKRRALVKRELRREKRAADAIRVKESGPYDEGSPHSWVRDVLLKSEPALRDRLTGRGMGESDASPLAVQERLRRHEWDVRSAVAQRSKYGERVRAMLHERSRKDDPELHRKAAAEELRGFTNGGGATASASGGGAAAFVPPELLLKAWAAYRTPFASFAGQCKTEDMPAYGLNLYVPHVTGAMEVTSQTEMSAVAEKAPTAGLIKGAVVNKSGQVEVSQQYLDRVGPGISGDQVLFAQLKMQIDTEVDAYALNQALVEAQTVTNSTASFSFAEASGVGAFLGDLRKGKNLVATTAGTRQKATHMFAPSKFVNYIEAFATTTGGPVWTPGLDDNRLPIRSEGDPQGEGYTGYLLLQLAVFADDNIPTVGTTSYYQVLVAAPATVLLFRSVPVFYVHPETYANTLDAVLGARVYTACVPRWPEGMAALTGAFYKSSIFA